MASIVDPPPDGKTELRSGDLVEVAAPGGAYIAEALIVGAIHVYVSDANGTCSWVPRGSVTPTGSPPPVPEPDPDPVYIPNLGGVVELMGDWSEKHDDRFLGHVAGVLYGIDKDHQGDGFGCAACRGDFPACPRLEDAEGVAFAWLIQRVTRG